jgi:glutathione S-transferase
VLGAGPYFAGDRFCIVDAVFGPVFRYFDVFDEIADFGVFRGLPKVTAWRRRLAARDSVRRAVSSRYPALLAQFIRGRGSELSRRAAASAAALARPSARARRRAGSVAARDVAERHRRAQVDAA